MSFKSKFLDRLCNRCGSSKCPKSQAKKVSRQSKGVPQVRVSQMMCGKIGVIEVPKISSQESVKAVKNCPSGENSREDV